MKRWSVAVLMLLIPRADRAPGDGPGAVGGTPGASVSAAVATPSYRAWGGGPIQNGPNVIDYRPPILYVPGPNGWTPYAPPLIVVAPGGGFPPPRPTSLLPPEPPEPVPVAPIRPPAPALVPRPTARRADPERSAQLITLGDRHFRAKDLIRASNRYEQALTADPASGAPRARLAQVAVARRQYREAALRLHEAQAAEPGWLAWSDDVKGLYGEPAEFAALIGELETHLQAHPEDRDACLILGVELFLSGQTRQAADVLVRLTDRKPDRVLAALLDATRTDPPEPRP